MADARMTEALANLIHTAIWREEDQSTMTSVLAWTAANTAVEQGWRPVEQDVQAKWVRSAVSSVVVVCEVDVVADQAVRITESVMFPGIVRHPGDAPRYRAITGAAAGEEFEAR